MNSAFGRLANLGHTLDAMSPASEKHLKPLLAQREDRKEVEPSVMVQVSFIGAVMMTPLMKACCKGVIAKVREELKNIKAKELYAELHARDDWAGSTVLHWAAYSGSVAVCRKFPVSNEVHAHLLPYVRTFCVRKLV